VPQCSDGVDNDGDVVFDFPADLGCESAADNDESGPLP
jgi:OOP family OmpA-OmpF porin